MTPKAQKLVERTIKSLLKTVVSNGHKDLVRHTEEKDHAVGSNIAVQ